MVDALKNIDRQEKMKSHIKTIAWTFLINVFFPGGGFAWNYNLKLALGYISMVFGLTFLSIAGFSYSDISLGKFTSVAFMIGGFLNLLAHAYVFKKVPAGDSHKGRKIRAVAVSFFFILLISIVGLKVTREYFVWVVYNKQSTANITKLPPETCGIIKRPDKDLQIGDTVAYLGSLENDNVIFVGQIKATSNQEYNSSIRGNIVIPDGHYFIEIENRGNGMDSNILGTIQRKQILGKISEFTEKSNANEILLFNIVKCF